MLYETCQQLLLELLVLDLGISYWAYDPAQQEADRAGKFRKILTECLSCVRFHGTFCECAAYLLDSEPDH